MSVFRSSHEFFTAFLLHSVALVVNLQAFSIKCFESNSVFYINWRHFCLFFVLSRMALSDISSISTVKSSTFLLSSATISDGTFLFYIQNYSYLLVFIYNTILHTFGVSTFLILQLQKDKLRIRLPALSEMLKVGGLT